MTQTKKVTLNPGESQEVAFSYTPLEAKTYFVTIDGLAGSFAAVSPVGPWECPVCGAKFATYPELMSHCYYAHPAAGQQIGMAIRNVGTTSADLCAGATMGCYFHFWLEDGIARKLVKSGYTPAHVDFCYHATGLVTGTQYLFAAFGVSGNRVVCSSMYFTPHEPW